MKYLLSSLFVFAFSVLTSLGQGLTDAEIEGRIRDFLASLDGAGAKLRSGEDGIQLAKSAELSSHSFSVYDIGNDDGFVVASNVADMPAVVAYADEGCAKVAVKANPAFADILKHWQSCNEVWSPSRPIKSGLPESVAPLLSDTWHQYEPFWRKTPMVGGEQCLTGCVAHAMGEVMKYYRYPERGRGTYSYTDSIGCGLTLTADFHEHVYDWDNILDSYVEGKYTEEQAEAVALLLSDCGISVNMRYSPDASGAYSVWQPIAMTKFFGYDRGMQMYFRDFFSWQEWEDMLRQELAEGRPVLMSGHSASQAHAFTCDGYDNQGLFHINWGWEGEADGFYNLQFLAPDLKQWYDKDNPERGLNLLQSVCVGIRPEGKPGPAETFSFAMSAIEPLILSAGRGAPVVVATHDMGNVGWNTHDGDVAMALKKDDVIVSILKIYDHAFLLEEIDDTVYNDTLEIIIPEDVDNGLYRLLPVYEDGDEWKEVRTSRGVPNHLLLEVDEDSVSLSRDKGGYADLKLVSLDFPDTLVWREAPAYSLSIRNDGEEYCGRIYFSLVTTDGKDKEYIFSSQGLTLGAGEECQRNFLRTPLDIGAGRYRLKIFYDVNLFNDTIVEFKNVGDRYITVLKSRPNSINDLYSDTDGDATYIYDVSGRFIMMLHDEDFGADFETLDIPCGIYVAVKNGNRIKFVKRRK